MNKVVVITGSTASGKSEFAIELAEQFNGEIISCDSVQVYRRMDIGSAKVSKEEQKRVPHHLIDIMDVDEEMSVALFQKLAREKIEEITSRNKLPICVGGTGFYIKSLLYDFRFEQEEKQEDSFDDYSNENLYEIIKEKDPKQSLKIHPNNRKRLLRLVRLMSRQQTTRTDLLNEQSNEILYDAKVYYLSMERKVLTRRISQRVDWMMENGLLDEVRRLTQDGERFDYQSFSAIGYREFRDYFDQKATLEEVIERIKAHTRQFSKRQMTWFKHQMPGEIIDVLDESYKQVIASSTQNWLKGVK